MEGSVFVSLRDHDKNADSAEILRQYQELGFRLYASKGTSAFLAEHGIDAPVLPFAEVKPRIEKDIMILINTPKAMNLVDTDTFPLRRADIERNLPVLTCMDTAKIFATAVRLKKAGTKPDYRAL